MKKYRIKLNYNYIKKQVGTRVFRSEFPQDILNLPQHEILHNRIYKRKGKLNFERFHNFHSILFCDFFFDFLDFSARFKKNYYLPGKDFDAYFQNL